MTLDFDRLVDISALAVITQYLGTCISIPRLRRLIPDDSTTYRIPGGWLCPALGTFISLAFLAQIHKSELGGALLVLLLGIAVSSGYRKFFCNSKGHG